ncbi:MAG: hypothetical protein QOD89_1317 [Bradyrhizobium sp.]|jgi:hypothetical protein|nr:hypothetical protein [Bradyrhizobium sp.]
MTVSATSVRFDEHTMWVDLTDGRALGVPLAWFPRLLRASPAQRERVELSRTGLHWEAINEDISIAGLLAGRPDDALSPRRHIAAIGERRYDSIKENLERDHFGAHVMINTDTSDYVVAPTISQAHAAFVERFGADAPGWSTRIGVSIFAAGWFSS